MSKNKISSEFSKKKENIGGFKVVLLVLSFFVLVVVFISILSMFLTDFK